MKTALECVPCFARQAAEVVELCALEKPERERLLRLLLREIAAADWNVMPVAISRIIHNIVKRETGQHDPYRRVKEQMNSAALALLPAMAEAARRHSNPREAAARLAIAGNLLDSGAQTRLEAAELEGHLSSIWDAPLAGSADALFRAADSASRILYLADNAGEIVFDRLLIEALPKEKITVAVRGMPVINDATMEDARTAGLPEMVPVISNGSNTPGTIYDECSEEFRRCFDASDLIVAKGQGNYETLSDTKKKIFFLLTVKCPMVAAALGAPVGTMVIKPASRVE